MEYSKVRLCKLFCAGLILIGVILSTPVQANAFSEQVIQHGATGDDVVELQARLQYAGYYNKTIDGVFGWSTYWALRNFQYEFGMEIDGVAGQQAKDKLVSMTKYDKAFVMRQIQEGNTFTYYGGTPQENQVKKRGNGGGGDSNAKDNANSDAPTTSAVNVPNGYSQNDIKLMANAVHGEARGEPYVGQVAVAAVILNRVEDPSFPNTISGVIFEPRAFTAVADGQIWLTPDETAEQAVLDAINGWDPSGGAIYYFNPNTATSPWIWGRPQIKTIGEHIFCM